MNQKYKNLTYFLVAVLLIIISLLHFYKIPLNTENQYSSSKDVVLSGVSEKNCDIFILFNKKIGKVKSNGNGKWIANLGRLPEGKYPVEVLVNDSPTSQSVATLQISVYSSKNSVSFITDFSKLMSAAILSQQNIPEKLKMVSY